MKLDARTDAPVRIDRAAGFESVIERRRQDRLQGFDAGTDDADAVALGAEIEVGVAFVDAERDVGFEEALGKS